jgi:nucleoside-triphosphatase THEP1
VPSSPGWERVPVGFAPQPWVDAVKARADVSVVEITLDNRQAMPGQILDWLGGIQGAVAPA